MDFQATLFADAGQAPARFERITLAHGAWVDVARNWLLDADQVFDALVKNVAWRAEERQMYDRVVTVPRLVAFYGIGEFLPHPSLTRAKADLSLHYLPELGEDFATAGCCFYRDGRDSVAWHGDRIGRSRDNDTVIAILSLGDPRRLLLRPRGGGPSTAFTLGHGDVLAMGGSCQRTWDHCVPKQPKAGPRISVQFRPRNVF
ncbi:MAG: alpha-ketoglutarate-dependent dioxygenase AlkB [Nocardioides sp.]